MNRKLNHLAIIMDGNARWAKKHGKTIAQGHKQGAIVVKNLLSYLPKFGIKYLTLYAFSSENWHRPENEVSILLALLSNYILKEVHTLNQYSIRLKFIGDLTKLPLALQQKIAHAIKSTEQHSNLTLCIAFSYGSRAEIIYGINQCLKNKIEHVTESNFHQYLYDSDMPELDLLIRTSGVYRLSNFLLWQLAYAELYFTDILWPDFGIQDLTNAIESYSMRNRTFGLRQ